MQCVPIDAALDSLVAQAVIKFNAASPLLPSGLLGPVALESPVLTTCDLE